MPTPRARPLTTGQPVRPRLCGETIGHIREPRAAGRCSRWSVADSDVPKTLEPGRRRQPAQSSARAFEQDEIARKGEYGQIRGAQRSYVVGQQRRTGACQGAGEARFSCVVGTDDEQSRTVSRHGSCVQRQIPLTKTLEGRLGDLHLGVLKQLAQGVSRGRALAGDVDNVAGRRPQQVEDVPLQVRQGVRRRTGSHRQSATQGRSRTGSGCRRRQAAVGDDWRTSMPPA